MFKSNLGYIAKPYLKTCLNIFKKNTSGLTIACLLSFLISILFPETQVSSFYWTAPYASSLQRRSSQQRCSLEMMESLDVKVKKFH